MRVLVACALQASSQWAHAINTIKMAQGFARLGHDVTVVCYRSSEGKVSSEKLSEVYGLTEPLRWVQLPRRLLRNSLSPHWPFALLGLSVALWVKPDLIFTRNYIFPWLTSKLRIATVAESHAHPDNKTRPLLRLVEATQCRAFRLWVTISQRLANHYHSLGVPEEKLVVLPDAVDLHLFRRGRHLPDNPYSKNIKNVVYAGHLYDDNGIPTVLEVALKLPGVHFHMIGGWPEDIIRQQNRAQALGLANITFHGLKPQSAVPPFLWHADVLLLPYSQHHPSVAWMSPLKLGEYLASGTPVVATSILALRDWLSEDDVKFVRPDDAEAMAKGIEEILDNPVYAGNLSRRGLEKVASFSYERRVQKILDRLVW